MADVAEKEELAPEEEETPKPKSEWPRRAMKFFGTLLMLALLAAAGFFAGIYMRVLDVREINEKIDLYALPFIGDYFVKPVGALGTSISDAITDLLKAKPPEEGAPAEGDDGKEKPEDKADKKEKPDKAGKNEKADKKEKEGEDAAKPPGQSEALVLTPEEIEKAKREEQEAEKKRVSKLARLYNSMKPADAAKIMADLDDEIAIAVLQKMDEAQAAKVLAAFEPAQSARLTQSMYTGRRSGMTSPGDQIAPARRGGGEI